jgi:hypothetical protein
LGTDPLGGARSSLMIECLMVPMRSVVLAALLVFACSPPQRSNRAVGRWTAMTGGYLVLLEVRPDNRYTMQASSAAPPDSGVYTIVADTIFLGQPHTPPLRFLMAKDSLYLAVGSPFLVFHRQ